MHHLTAQAFNLLWLRWGTLCLSGVQLAVQTNFEPSAHVDLDEGLFYHSGTSVSTIILMNLSLQALVQAWSTKYRGPFGHGLGGFGHD